MRKLTVLTALLAIGVALPLSPRQEQPRRDADGRLLRPRSELEAQGRHDDGRVETEFEVDQNVNGRRWNVVIRRNGVVVFRGARVTRAPSGSFSVNRRIANAAGRDRIVATARSVVGGGVCRGVVSV